MTDDRDITERLEDPSYDGAIYMRQDAAKEIRRLREYSSKQALDIVTLGQEVGRLREALREIAGARPQCCEITDAMQYIARAALAGKEPK